MAITKDQVFEVCTRLDSEGKSPTLALVRELLGGGSFTTISAYVKAWKDSGASALSVDPVVVPDAVVTAMEAATKTVWRIASDAAAAAWESERSELMARLHEAGQERDAAYKLADAEGEKVGVYKNNVDYLEAQLLTVRHSAATARGEADALQSELQAMRGQFEMLQAQLIAAERRAAAAEALAEHQKSAAKSTSAKAKA